MKREIRWYTGTRVFIYISLYIITEIREITNDKIKMEKSFHWQLRLKD